MSESSMVAETRVMRAIATQLEKLNGPESKMRVLQFVNSTVGEALKKERDAEYAIQAKNAQTQVEASYALQRAAS